MRLLAENGNERAGASGQTPTFGTFGWWTPGPTHEISRLNLDGLTG
jgi:hypothetical protein